MTIDNVLDFTETLDFKDFESVYNSLTEQRKSSITKIPFDDNKIKNIEICYWQIRFYMV